jgi:hypothetical protein
LDEKGPLAQPVMPVTMLAVASPRPIVTNQLPVLIFIIFPNRLKATASAGLAPWGETLMPP